MTSDRPAEIAEVPEVYVWIWLPNATEPVVAGRLFEDGSPDLLRFNYGRSYLERPEAIPIYLPELPLQSGSLPLLNGLMMPNCIRDGAPDAWGRRVILNRLTGLKGRALDGVDIPMLTLLLESGSDRIGALDFQESPHDYVGRTQTQTSLEDLLLSADYVERGTPLTPELDAAISHGTAIGGARPKALISADKKKYVAKFSSTNDTYSVVKAEFIAMRLAERCGLNVASVSLARASGKDVLLIERFDRLLTERGWQRRSIVSALTLFGLDEMMARYASYEALAQIIRHRFTDPRATLRELFARMVFNILCGNTDDHARNHAAFWDGKSLSLTPAYDICPQGRSGQEASQAMLLNDRNNLSQIGNCLASSRHFLLSSDEALTIIKHQMHVISDRWREVCDEAAASDVDRRLFWGRQFLNPFAFTNLDEEVASLAALADELRRANNH